MADKAILNVAFSFGPIHLTVNRVTHPVSTEFFALGLSKTMLWSDDPQHSCQLSPCVQIVCVKGKLLHRQCLFWNGKRIDMGPVEIEHENVRQNQSFKTFHDDGRYGHSSEVV